jgi:hypothetical protein
MKFRDYINEARRNLPYAIKKKINKEISKVLSPTYFKAIPLKDLFDILDKYGIVPIQEDKAKWSGLLIGGVDKTEMVDFDLAWKDSKQGNIYTEMVPNAALVMSYYKMPSGKYKYEVIGYLS